MGPEAFIVLLFGFLVLAALILGVVALGKYVFRRTKR